jgi:hypothetical protein
MAKRTVTRDIRSLDDLAPDPRNARRHTKRNLDTIEASLREVGAARSIVIDESGEVLAGNGVVRSAKKLGNFKVKVVDVEGDEIVAVRRTGLSETSKRRLALFDNRAGELAEWDGEVLADLLSEVGSSGLFSKEEMDNMVVASDVIVEKVVPPPELGHGFFEFYVRDYVKIQALWEKLARVIEDAGGIAMLTTGKVR